MTKRVVTPVRYPGGKAKLARRLLDRFWPKIKVDLFVEPCVGGGSVFIEAKNRGLAKRYWINDIYQDLMCFWHTLKDKEMNEELRLRLKEFWFWSMYKNEEERDEERVIYLRRRRAQKLDATRMPLHAVLDRAERFYYLNRVSFSGTTEMGGFSSHAALGRFTLSSIRRLRPFSEFLKGVKLTSVDVCTLLHDLPTSNHLVYLDVPYMTTNRLYRHHEFDHERLSSVLRSEGIDFFMTLDDCDESRKLFRWAHIHPLKVQYSMSSFIEGGNRRAPEIVVTTYAVEEELPESSSKSKPRKYRAKVLSEE